MNVKDNRNKSYKKSSAEGIFSLKSLMSVLVVAAILIIGFFFGDNLTDDKEIGEVSYKDADFCVSFIDVGQGDCSLISCEGINILVDGGESSAGNKVIKYLKDFGVEKLDCYIGTHPHSDHIGSTDTILENIPCDKVFTTYFSEFNIPTSKVYESFVDSVYESGAEVIAVDAGDVYTFGNLTIEIFAPIVESDDYNEMSIVFMARYKDMNVMFTGDTTVNVEKEMLENNFDLNADVIKLAHHGSTTSNSLEFLNAVSPEFAIISCGEDNSYGHPHKEVVDRLINNEIKYLRTDYEGTIVCYGDGYEYVVEAAA